MCTNNASYFVDTVTLWRLSPTDRPVKPYCTSFAFRLTGWPISTSKQTLNSDPSTIKKALSLLPYRVRHYRTAHARKTNHQYTQPSVADEFHHVQWGNRLTVSVLVGRQLSHSLFEAARGRHLFLVLWWDNFTTVYIILAIQCAVRLVIGTV